MTKNTKPHVFISYSRKDTNFVNKLEQALRAEGILTWRDIHSIAGGAKWFRRIKQGLEASYAMIYVDTENAELSDWVEREFLFGASLNLPIIPVKIDPRFMSLQTINLNPILCDEDNFKVGIGKLIAQLATLPHKPIVSGATVPPEPERKEIETDLSVDSESLSDLNFSAEIQDYVRWLLVKSQADLRDALYVSLEATAQSAQKAKEDNPFGFGLDMDLDMGFDPLALERVRGDAFDKVGEPIADARVPVTEANRVVLLGEPGSGKTTTLLQLAVDLARALQTDETAPIPVFVPLRKYDGSTDFVSFVCSQMYNLQAVYDDLLKHHDVIFLLDALNEMPRTADDGRKLMPDIQDFATEQARWVLSCRVRDYQEELKEIPDVNKVRLQPLDPPRIKDVIIRRFAEQYAPAGIATKKDGEQLWQAMYGTDDLLKVWNLFVQFERIEKFWQGQWDNDIKPDGEQYRWNSLGYDDWGKMSADKRRMMHLCRNPYMSKMVSDIYAIDKSLPDNRGALFKKFVDKLLDRDRKAAESIGARWIDDKLIREGLAQIAYAMGSETEMPRTEAETLLHEHLPHEDKALLLRLAQGASLLDVGNDVRFTHQLLQEYFASEVLGTEVDKGTDPATIWQADKWWKPTGREETAIILAGVRGDPEAIARWIAPAQPEFAIEVIRESGVGIALEDISDATRQVIIDSANAKKNSKNPQERAAAYRVLGTFDADNRPYIGVKDGLPNIDWVHIPAGKFVYGDDDKESYPDYAKPADRQEIDLSAFDMSRYPITYAQFQCFVDAEDSLNSTEHDWFEGLSADEGDKQLSEQSFKYNNHPRESVTWYQAMAFCRWWSWKLKPDTFDMMNVDTWAVRLPTEFEWEKAARGTDGREYPYEGDFDASKGNTRETGISKTSAVGIFQEGASPYGVLDMSGNVWEWCLTEYHNPAEHLSQENISSSSYRVLRGGSFASSYLNARAAFRSQDLPFSRYGSIGFRVVRPRR